eukprot:Transcript_3123.p2 GENE.Transcript_3123~~Transcript_3123.p2  ORF type:complete len:191 (+),score=47.94 Transcript_3123:22-573(+)
MQTAARRRSARLEQRRRRNAADRIQADGHRALHRLRFVRLRAAAVVAQAAARRFLARREMRLLGEARRLEAARGGAGSEGTLVPELRRQLEEMARQRDAERMAKEEMTRQREEERWAKEEATRQRDEERRTKDAAVRECDVERTAKEEAVRRLDEATGLPFWRSHRSHSGQRAVGRTSARDPA